MTVADANLADVFACITSAFDAFNRGDVASFSEHWSSNITAIINEAPPHVWIGEAALSQWLADSFAETAASASADQERRIALKECLKAKIDGDRAFMVLVVTMSATRGHERIEEDGVQISCLARRDGPWQIEALAYGGGLATRILPA